MAKIKKLINNNETIYPITHEDAVFNSDGISVGDALNDINTKMLKLEDVDDIEDLLHDKNRIIVNVKKYGLIGDGLFDNTENMQNIINNVNDNNCVLIFPPGIYNMTNINISKSNISIIGIGNVIIQTIKNTIHGLFNWDDNVYNNIMIKNITFKGEMLKANSILHFKGVDGLTVSNCNFVDCGGKVIIGADGYVNKNILIDTCLFNNTVNGGIEIRPCENIIIRNCMFKDIVGYSTEAAAHPIYLRADTTKENVQHTLKNINIYNNLFEDIKNPLYGATYAIKVVVNSQFTTNEEVIIDNIVIANNNIDWKGGIYVNRADNCYIKNNVINVECDDDIRFIAILSDQINNNYITNNEININTIAYSKCISIDSNINCNISNNNIRINYGSILEATNTKSKNINSLNIFYNYILSQGSSLTDYAIQLSSNIDTFKFINNIQECDIRCIHCGVNNISNVFVMNNTFIYIDNNVSTGVGVRLDNANITNKYQYSNTFINFENPKNENNDTVIKR